MSATRPTPWRPSDLTVNGRELHSVRLTTGAGRPDIQLVFLRLPDGQPDGAGTATFGNQSLLKLWQGKTKSIGAIDGSTRYTSAALTSTLTALIERFCATTVRTLDYMNTQLGYSEDLTGGVDHSDHDVTARYMRIATLAAQQRMRHLALVAYEGYGISTRPANLPASVVARKTAIFQNYDIHDDKDGDGCSAKIYCAPTKTLAADYANWVQRHYERPLPAPQAGTIVSWIGDTAKSYTNASLCLTSQAGGVVGTSHCGAAGQQWRLRYGLLHAGTATGQCVTTNGTSVTLGSCRYRAAWWQVTRLGQLRTARGCLTQDDMLSLKPRLHLAACSAVNPGQRWFSGTGVR
jgi:hypothetical protein